MRLCPKEFHARARFIRRPGDERSVAFGRRIEVLCTEKAGHHRRCRYSRIWGIPDLKMAAKWLSNIPKGCEVLFPQTPTNKPSYASETTEGEKFKWMCIIVDFMKLNSKFRNLQLENRRLGLVGPRENSISAIISNIRILTVNTLNKYRTRFKTSVSRFDQHRRPPAPISTPLSASDG